MTALVPPGPVTVTPTTDPAVPGGAVAVMEPAEFTVNVLAGIPPKLTVLAPVNDAPVMVTTVPPAAGPLAGATPLTVGAAAMYVKRSADVGGEVPPGAVTVTGTEAGVPAGLVAVTRVAEFTVNVVAGVDPKCTAVAPLNPAPRTDTTVPPRCGPLPGLTPVTTGP